MKKLRVGTRPSKLALAQTSTVIGELSIKFPDFEFETVVIKTSGDSKQTLVGEISRDKRDWIEELEKAILEESIDFAIHSGKDVPYDISTQTSIHSVLTRADPRDVFIGKAISQNSRKSFVELAQGATVGTASLRRRAQLLILRPDLVIQDLRGNVPTRINKLDSEAKYDGIVLAAAGLDRLDIPTLGMDLIPAELMLPASAQGILSVQYRKDRNDIEQYIKTISCVKTQACLLAERSAVRCLEADCSSAVAVYAQVIDDKLEVIGKVFSHSGSDFIEASARGQIGSAEILGDKLGKNLLAKGAKELIR